MAYENTNPCPRCAGGRILGDAPSCFNCGWEDLAADRERSYALAAREKEHKRSRTPYHDGARI